MIFYLILGFSALVLLGVGVACYKIRKAGQEIDRLFKQNEQLQQEKAVAQTQVKHFETRNSRNYLFLFGMGNHYFRWFYFCQ